MSNLEVCCTLHKSLKTSTSIVIKMIKRALIITGNGYQDSEVLYPYYRLQEDDFEVDVAAIKSGDLIGILGTKMIANKSFSEIKIEDYSILILPGGVKAIEKIRLEKGVISFIAQWNSLGKIIGSICHGAQLLISAKVTNGRRISGYYSIEDDINNSGAIYVDAPFVIDRNIISSPHYKHLGPWMKETLKEFYKKNDKEDKYF